MEKTLIRWCDRNLNKEHCSRHQIPLDSKTPTAQLLYQDDGETMEHPNCADVYKVCETRDGKLTELYYEVHTRYWNQKAEKDETYIECFNDILEVIDILANKVNGSCTRLADLLRENTDDGLFSSIKSLCEYSDHNDYDYWVSIVNCHKTYL
jgi:hypothetical protein